MAHGLFFQKFRQTSQAIQVRHSKLLLIKKACSPITPNSSAPSGKETVQPVETSKQPAKVQKTTPEIKPAQTPVTTQPVRPQQQTTQQQPTQPVVSAPQSQQQPVQQQAKPAETSPAPVPFVAIESQPELIHREPAKYPEIAQKMGLQGRVYVEVSIDAQGKPIQAKVIKSASDVFNDAAIEAVMKFTFKPAMMSTGPVSSKMTIPIDFRMAH